MVSDEVLKSYQLNIKQVSEFILGCNTNNICSSVVLAPCWSPESVGIHPLKLISDNSPKIWCCQNEGIPFTYIQAGVGAGNCSDIVMSLKVTACKKVLFLGSAGSINKNIKIGDLFIPNTVACGDGLCRYISDDLERDCFLEEYHPNKSMMDQIYEASLGESVGLDIGCHIGKSLSVETIFFQFQHIEYFMNQNCDCLEMESAAFFKTATASGLDAVAAFCISDNVLLNQSLVTVSDDITRFRKHIRRVVMPKVILAFLGGD